MDRLHGVNEERTGLGYGLAAYLLWGLFPLYFTLFARSGAVEVVAHRALWSLVFCALLLTVLRQWGALRAALAALPVAEIATIRRRLDALGPAPAAPVTCPLLDPQSGACPVYAARPLACRSYGFYVERDTGLYCAEIEARVAAGAYPEVIWGHQGRLETRLAALGETRPLGPELLPPEA